MIKLCFSPRTASAMNVDEVQITSLIVILHDILSGGKLNLSCCSVPDALGFRRNPLGNDERGCRFG